MERDTEPIVRLQQSDVKSIQETDQLMRDLPHFSVLANLYMTTFTMIFTGNMKYHSPVATTRIL